MMLKLFSTFCRSWFVCLVAFELISHFLLKLVGLLCREDRCKAMFWRRL